MTLAHNTQTQTHSLSHVQSRCRTLTLSLLIFDPSSKTQVAKRTRPSPHLTPAARLSSGSKPPPAPRPSTSAPPPTLPPRAPSPPASTRCRSRNPPSNASPRPEPASRDRLELLRRHPRPRETRQAPADPRHHANQVHGAASSRTAAVCRGRRGFRPLPRRPEFPPRGVDEWVDHRLQRHMAASSGPRTNLPSSPGDAAVGVDDAREQRDGSDGAAARGVEL